MVIREKIGTMLHISKLYIDVESKTCISCNQCTKSCPMSMDVKEKVKNGEIIDTECIKCDVCVDICLKPT